MSQNVFKNRKLRLCYYSTNPKTINLNRYNLEKRLEMLGAEIEIKHLTSIDNKTLTPCDLLVIDAARIPQDAFKDWLLTLTSRLTGQNNIWIPALIFAKYSFASLADSLAKVYEMNWYFDLIDPDHLDSIPIRIANLLRIHDHLHELNRYNTRIYDLTLETEGLRAQLHAILDKNK